MSGTTFKEAAVTMGGSLKRVVTGIILIPIVLIAVIYAPVFWMFALSSVVCLLALLEFNTLSVPDIRDSRFDAVSVIAGALVPFAGFLWGPGVYAPYLVACSFLFFLFCMMRKRDLRDASIDVAYKTLALVYVAVPLSYLAFLSALENGRSWIIFLFIIIWANDTFAYFAGRSFGKTKLLESVSPKKTVEGAVAGLFGGIVAAVIFDHYAMLGMGPLLTSAVAVAAGLIGITGDLAESLLKRGAGVKDSGTIIPGHGGLLDRIDSLIFPLPALYYFIVWQMQAY